ncbi:MAG: LysM peptidoglycan-binding domain-containing protein [Clostridia bacterium]|nr:LysM peptidoglycan-binding domain-containing protein [Clostridia bacterium]
MRVRAKTVTKTIRKTLPPVHSLDFVVPPLEEPVTQTTLPEDEQERIEVFRQVEEAVADEGLMAFRELPLEDDVEDVDVVEDEPEPVSIFVPEEETMPAAGLVVLGAPPVIPFVEAEEPEVEPETESEAEPEAEPEAAQTVAVSSPCPGKPYMVRRGDSFQLVARRFDVSVRALMEANPELQPGRLIVGDVLCIPLADPPAPVATPAPAPTPPSRQDTHRVQEGESIADILLASDVSLNAFQAMNPTLRLGQQRVGDILRLPERGARGRCNEGMPHSVAEGEDIAALAARHGVTVGMLLRVNPHLLPSDFRAGQVVCVPRRG